jgi:hypothetical protein
MSRKHKRNILKLNIKSGKPKILDRSCGLAAFSFSGETKATEILCIIGLAKVHFLRPIVPL